MKTFIKYICTTLLILFASLLGLFIVLPGGLVLIFIATMTLLLTAVFCPVLAIAGTVTARRWSGVYDEKGTQ